MSKSSFNNSIYSFIPREIKGYIFIFSFFYSFKNIQEPNKSYSILIMNNPNTL